MLKILFVMNILVITAFICLFIGFKYFKNDEFNIKGIKYILWGTNVAGICIILSAMLL